MGDSDGSLGQEAAVTQAPGETEGPPGDMQVFHIKKIVGIHLTSSLRLSLTLVWVGGSQDGGQSRVHYFVSGSLGRLDIYCWGNIFSHEKLFFFPFHR